MPYPSSAVKDQPKSSATLDSQPNISQASFKPFVRSVALLIIFFSLNYPLSLAYCLMDRGFSLEKVSSTNKLFEKIYSESFESVSCLILIIGLLLLSIFRTLARSILKYPILLSIYISHFYLVFIWTNRLLDLHKNLFEVLLTIYIIIFSSCLSLYFTCVLPVKKIRIRIGVAAGLILSFLHCLFFEFGLKWLSDFSVTTAVVLFFTFLFSFYLNKDIHIMVKYRGNDYTNEDWAKGFADLHTDIFFKFWRDVCKTKHMIAETQEIPLDFAENTSRSSEEVVYNL